MDVETRDDYRLEADTLSGGRRGHHTREETDISLTRSAKTETWAGE